MVLEVIVSFNDPFSVANPKSITLIWFFELTMMFSALMLRCTMPCVWASCRASATWIA